MSRTPKLATLPPGKINSLPLSPVEAYILSRIDGTTTERELVSITGLEALAISAALDKLAAIGAVTFGAEVADGAPRDCPASPVAEAPPASPVTETSPASPSPAAFDPAELDEDAELTREHKARVLGLFYGLDDLDHYALLGVGRDADKKAVKRAYFDAAALFHPDRFFRKRLGSFKQKMEAVFSRITIAHDTLTDPEKRADYDAYLESVSRTKALEGALGEEPGAAEVPAGPPSPATAAPTAGPTLAGASERPGRPSGSPVAERTRRETLARRLLGGRSSSPPGRTISVAPAPADGDALRRHYELRVGAMRDRLTHDHVEAARACAAKSDWIGATTAYRLALQTAPEDAQLRREMEAAHEKAQKILGEQYRQQAAYEEKNADWVSASRSWTRAAVALKVDAAAHERAANALRLAAGNLHDAAEHAKQAILLDGKKAKYRITLAEVYVAAGLHLSARRELDAATRLAPGDATIQALVKRVKAE